MKNLEKLQIATALLAGDFKELYADLLRNLPRCDCGSPASFYLQEHPQHIVLYYCGRTGCVAAKEDGVNESVLKPLDWQWHIVSAHHAGIIK